MCSSWQVEVWVAQCHNTCWSTSRAQLPTASDWCTRPCCMAASNWWPATATTLQQYSHCCWCCCCCCYGSKVCCHWQRDCRSTWPVDTLHSVPGRRRSMDLRVSCWQSPCTVLTADCPCASSHTGESAFATQPIYDIYWGITTAIFSHFFLQRYSVSLISKHLWQTNCSCGCLCIHGHLEIVVF